MYVRSESSKLWVQRGSVVWKTELRFSNFSVILWLCMMTCSDYVLMGCHKSQHCHGWILQVTKLPNCTTTLACIKFLTEWDSIFLVLSLSGCWHRSMLEFREHFSKLYRMISNDCSYTCAQSCCLLSSCNSSVVWFCNICHLHVYAWQNAWTGLDD